MKVNNNCRKTQFFRYMQSRNNVKLIFICAWFISTTVLTKTFSSLLLNTYFRPKSVKVVNNLDELSSRKDLNIIGNDFSIYVLKFFKPEFEQFYDKFVKLKDEFNKKFSDKTEFSKLNKKLNEVLRGESVYLDNSLIIYDLQVSYPESNLLTTEDKYFPFYLSHFVSKRVAFHQRIKSL